MLLASHWRSEKNDFLYGGNYQWLNFQKDKCQIYSEKREGEQDLHFYQLPSKHLGHYCISFFEFCKFVEVRDPISVSCR